jgi:hypothetical protein
MLALRLFAYAYIDVKSPREERKSAWLKRGPPRTGTETDN